LFILAAVAIPRLTFDLLGDNQQRASEAVKSLLPIAAAAVGFPLIVWRLVILNQQTRISEEKTQIDRETHYTSIFSRSVDQLGQTREIKESRNQDGEFESVTKTAPNIEVRLGGIHSLTRLAEESVRDRGKIENTLRSYVRENSWSDRDGTVSRLPKAGFPRSFSWSWSYNPKDTDSKKNLEKWVAESKRHADSQIEWTRPLAETRVDVNEALDAVVSIRGYSNANTAGRYYECLFVGQSLGPDLLRVSDFERCTFVNCSIALKDNPQVKFSLCRIISSKMRGKNASLNISRSDLINVAFDDIENCIIEVRSSELYNCHFWDLNRTTLKIPSSTMNGGWLGGNADVTLDASSATIYKADFDRVIFSADSIFDNCTLVDSTFKGANLSQVKRISPDKLASMLANPITAHPTSFERPKGWPKYDVNFKDPDEIPF
jgi:uncharacterized protein YjbI with pentapeptide repeats